MPSQADVEEGPPKIVFVVWDRHGGPAFFWTYGEAQIAAARWQQRRPDEGPYQVFEYCGFRRA